MTLSDGTAENLGTVHKLPTKANEEAEAKAKAKADKKAAKAKPEAEVVKFTDLAEGATEAAGAYEAKLRAEAERTAVGKRYSDRIKQAGDKLKGALEEESETITARAHTSLQRARAKVKELTAEWEKAATDDSGAIGKAYRKLAKVKEERADEKDKAAAAVERKSSAFVKVMEQLRLSI